MTRSEYGNTQVEVPDQKSVCPDHPDGKCLCPDFRAFKSFPAFNMASKISMSRLLCVQNSICPDFFAFKDTCNGCSPCVSQRKFYTAQFVLSGYKICPDTSFMQFAFVTVNPFCCTYRCITNSVCNYWLILVFSTINLNWIATDHTIRDLFMYTSSIR